MNGSKHIIDVEGNNFIGGFMMNQPDYRDFYPKTLIPIGANDKQALESMQLITEPAFKATHWLVALQARVKSYSEESYHWQVYLFPADTEGSYSWGKPYLVSNYFDTLDQALEISNELETYGRDDSIISSNYREKIS